MYLNAQIVIYIWSLSIFCSNLGRNACETLNWIFLFVLKCQKCEKKTIKIEEISCGMEMSRCDKVGTLNDLIAFKFSWFWMISQLSRENSVKLHGSDASKTPLPSLIDIASLKPYKFLSWCFTNLQNCNFPPSPIPNWQIHLYKQHKIHFEYFYGKII